MTFNFIRQGDNFYADCQTTSTGLHKKVHPSIYILFLSLTYLNVITLLKNKFTKESIFPLVFFKYNKLLHSHFINVTNSLFTRDKATAVKWCTNFNPIIEIMYFILAYEHNFTKVSQNVVIFGNYLMKLGFGLHGFSIPMGIFHLLFKYIEVFLYFNIFYLLKRYIYKYSLYFAKTVIYNKDHGYSAI